MNPLIILAGIGGLILLTRKKETSPSNGFSASVDFNIPKPATTTTTKKPSTTDRNPTVTNTETPLTRAVKTAIAAGNFQAQAVWLRDNGAPKTADALESFGRGETSLTTLLAVATTESLPGYAAPKAGAKDSYAAWLLSSGASLDELYAYAKDSNDVSFLKAVADRLAAAGDSRAMDLTIRLSQY